MLCLSAYKHWNTCGMFVAEQLLFTCTTETKETVMLTIKHIVLCFQAIIQCFKKTVFLMWSWSILQCISYNVYNKSRRQWALNIYFHKLGFHFLTSSVSVSSNLACTVIVTQQQFVDWWKLILVVWFQTGYSIKWEYFWIKS